MANNHQCVESADSEKVPQVVDQEGCPDSSPSRALIPEDSDFFPSVSLAVALLLIFISVLPMLSQPGMVFVPFRKLDNISRREVHFHPLLYIQPPSTQLSIETLAKDREETITVLAVAKEHATQTLVCFSKNVLALLLKQGQGEPITQQITEVKTLKYIKNISNARALGTYSVSVTTQRMGHIPRCTILTPTSPITGNICLMEITLGQDREVIMRRESFIIAHELLELVHKTGQVPETFVVKGSPRHRVKVIHVLGDPYLESGIIC